MPEVSDRQAVRAARARSTRASARSGRLVTAAAAPLRVAVVGTAASARMHAELLAHDVPGAGVALAAAARPPTPARRPRRVGRAARRGAARRGRRRDCSPRDVDAVAICSSTDTHVDLMVVAAEAGKPIFCEKPMSLDLAEVDRALAAVERAGVPLQVGFNRRFDPAHRPCTRRRRVGCHRAAAPRAHHEPRPAPAAARVRRRSGGIFLDMTIHDFDMARFVTGSEVVEVFARGAVRIEPELDAVGDLDTAVVTLVHENGCLTVIDNTRQAVYGYDQRVEAFGAGGIAASENPPAHSATCLDAAGAAGRRSAAFFLERYVPSYLRPVGGVRRRRRRPAGRRRSGADGRAPLSVAIAAEVFGAPVARPSRRRSAGTDRRRSADDCARFAVRFSRSGITTPVPRSRCPPGPTVERSSSGCSAATSSLASE